MPRRSRRRLAGALRPAFVPYAIGATAILAVNALLLQLHVLSPLRVLIPPVALVLLAIAFAMWRRSPRG